MSFWNQLVDRFRTGEGEEIDWEALLIEADLGMKLATEWVEEIQEKGLSRQPEKAEALLREKMVKLVRIPPPLPIKQKPEVILLIGGGLYEAGDDPALYARSVEFVRHVAEFKS